MSYLRGLYARFRQLIHEGAKFGVVGAIGFVVTDGGTNLLHGIGWLKAAVIATLAATVVTFVGSRYWTFRDRERSGMGRESVLFFVLNGVGLAITLACLGFTNYALGLKSGLPSNIALFLGIVLGTLFRFWSYRKWVWTAPAATGPPTTGQQTTGPSAPASPPPVTLGETDGKVPDEAGTAR